MHFLLIHLPNFLIIFFLSQQHLIIIIHLYLLILKHVIYHPYPNLLFLYLNFLFLLQIFYILSYPPNTFMYYHLDLKLNQYNLYQVHSMYLLNKSFMIFLVVYNHVVEQNFYLFLHIPLLMNIWFFNNFLFFSLHVYWLSFHVNHKQVLVMENVNLDHPFLDRQVVVIFDWYHPNNTI